ncbi:MAG: 2,3-bisphosphoglycerate-independent phosphoglycerate mutase [Bacilli bacterium]|nr:2,3-bisphosphoglycerate-independent phosphoglycerate mutase [Bacilli bacterium]
MKKTILLCIMDGCGIRKEDKGNAFEMADKPNFNYLLNKYPNCTIEASGEAVGLPKGVMGNSEVGHLNMGAGRVVYQPLELINRSIEDESFYQKPELLKVINHVKENKSNLHIMGLLSDGGVHSHINHLMAILDMCKKQQLKNVYLHVFTDGRDVSPTSSYSYIKQVQKKLDEIGFGKIASISGRYYAMDRDNNYDRLKKAYDVIVNGIGQIYNNIEQYISDNYKNNITDEFLLPARFENISVNDNDGVIGFNFRKDRFRELFTALTNKDFNDMDVKRLNNLSVVTMMPVVGSVKCPHIFDDLDLNNILGKVLNDYNLSQLRIAETEKYAHVTFFFDGGKEIDYNHEKKILIPSPKVATYDLKPEMSADLITEKLIPEIGKFDVIILNFANGDMVGHTGVIDACVKAVEVIDNNLGKIYKKIKEVNGIMLITADHGNCEEMLTKDNKPMTAHTTNLVRLIVTKEGLNLNNGKLADIAPTILDLLNVKKPDEMTGNSLIVK